MTELSIVNAGNQDPWVMSKVRGTTGYVCRGDRIIGRVHPQNRVLAGTGGKRGRAWTATPTTDGGASFQGAGSIGTRYPSARAAFAALVAFDRSYPPARLASMAAIQPEPSAWSLRYYGSAAAYKMRGAVSRAVNEFRRDHSIIAGKRFDIETVIG